MNSVLIQRRGRNTQGEENDVTVETETGLIHLQVKECKHQNPEKARKDSFPPVSESVVR